MTGPCFTIRRVLSRSQPDVTKQKEAQVQVFNRDLSCIVIALYAQWRYIERAEARARRGLRGQAADEAVRAERTKLYSLTAAELDELLRVGANSDGLTILDALAATGLRSIRYAKEVPGVKRVIANDLDRDAAEACAKNIKSNDVPEGMCEAKCSDAVSAMFETLHERAGRTYYDVIDIDPYGSCAPFIDAAVQCINDGGLLCVTSTDMPVLSGNHPEVCFSRYGSMPTKAKHLHEYSLRIVINAIESCAARYQRHIVPVLCVSIDFYVRVFVRVFRSPAEVKKSCLKRGYVLQSTGCPSFYIQPLGRITGRDRFGGALLHTNKQAGIQSSNADLTRRRRRRDQEERAANCTTTTIDGNRNDGAKDTDMTEAGTGDAEIASIRPEHAETDYSRNGAGTSLAPAGEIDVPQTETANAKREDDERVPPEFCGETGAPFKLGGPIWTNPLHDRDWVTAAIDRVESNVDKYLSTNERIHGVLTAISEELFDVPLYYTLPDLCGTLHCESPKLAEVKAALMHAGYRCSQSHRDPDAIKTDAPPRIVWDIMRCWCIKHPVSAKRLADQDSAVAKILSKPPKLMANFATTAAMRSKQTKARRWAPNPEDYWGPKAAARGRKQPRHH